MSAKQTNFIIFDMDGLLVDTERVYRDGWLCALKKNNISIAEDVVNSWVGKGMHETGAYLLEACGDEEMVEKVRNDREDHIYDCIEKKTLLAKPYAKEVLKEAKKRGYFIGLATSTSEKRSRDILHYLGLFEYIDIPVFGSMVKNLKPYPDLYLKALETAKCKPENAVVVEDSITGAKAAQAAGIRTILVPDNNFNEMDIIPENVIIKGMTLSAVIQWMDRNKDFDK